jgi:hypothetical protein
VRESIAPEIYGRGGQPSKGSEALIARATKQLGWIVVVAFSTGFLLIYALAAGVLLGHGAFCVPPPRFESCAHYFLIATFGWGFALSGLRRPLFYTPFLLTVIAAIAVWIAAAFRARKNMGVPLNVRP